MSPECGLSTLGLHSRILGSVYSSHQIATGPYITPRACDLKPALKDRMPAPTAQTHTPLPKQSAAYDVATLFGLRSHGPNEGRVMTCHHSWRKARESHLGFAAVSISQNSMTPPCLTSANGFGCTAQTPIQSWQLNIRAASYPANQPILLIHSLPHSLPTGRPADYLSGSCLHS
jgi:hypothetical protein